MKKLITLMSAMAVLSSSASAEILKNFKYDGSLEINAYNINNTDFDKNSDDKVGDVDTRLMLNMSFDLNKDANGVVTLVKNNRQWGDGSEDLNTIQSELSVEQAYLNLKGIMGMDHKLGRQFYGNPGDLVIYFGPKMWPYPKKFPVDAIDAWVGKYEYKDWTFTGILGKIENKNTNNQPDKDKNLSGIDVKRKFSDNLNANVYYYYQNNKSTSTGKSDYLGVIGARVNWDCKFVSGLNLGLEYDQNTGKDLNTSQKHKGYAYKINANYSIDLAGKLGFNAEYVYMSGEKDSTTSDTEAYYPINKDYRPGIIANGFGIGYFDDDYRTIVTQGTITYNPKDIDKLNLELSYYNFKNPGKTNYKNGNELDFVATWKHSDKVSINGYYAMFKPDTINSGTKDDMATALGASFVVKF